MENPESIESEELLGHASWIRRLARSLIADPAAADDVVQDTWLAALKHPPARNRPLRPWLRQVVRNFARYRARSDAHREQREQGAMAKLAQPSPEELVQRAEEQRALVDLVLGLSEPNRSAILLRYYEGLTPAQISELQGVPSATVRSRIKRGLDELRAKLDERFGGDRNAWCSVLMPLPLTLGPAVDPSATLSPLGQTGAETMLTATKLAAAVAAVAVAGVATYSVLTKDSESDIADTTSARVEPPSTALEPERAGQPEVAAGAVVSPVEPNDSGDARSAVAGPEAAPVRGKLMDTTDGKPLAHFALSVSQTDDEREIVDHIVTDANGHFETRHAFAPGEVKISLVDHKGSGERAGFEAPVEWKERVAALDASLARQGALTPDAVTERRMEEQLLADYEQQLKAMEMDAFEAVEKKQRSVPRELFVEHTTENGGDELEIAAGPTMRLYLEMPEGHERDELSGGQAFLRPQKFRDLPFAWTPVRGGLDAGKPWVRFGLGVPTLFPQREVWFLEVKDDAGLWIGASKVKAMLGTHKKPAKIAMEPRGVLYGRVVDTKGNPIAAQGVRLVPRDEEIARRNNERLLAETDDRGNYVLKWLPPGSYDLHVVLDGVQDFGQTVEVVLGRTQHNVTILPLTERVSVAGRIVSETGTFNNFVQVYLARVDAEMAPKHTYAHWSEQNGVWAARFEFGSLEPGDYRVWHEGSDYRKVTPEDLVVTVPGGELEFLVRDDLPTQQLVFAPIDTQTGAPIDDYVVRFVLDPNDAREFTQYTGSGPLHIDAPLGVENEWRIQAEGYQPVWGTQELFDSRGRAALALERGWGTAFVVTAEGGSAAGASVILDGVEVGKTDERGVLRMGVDKKPTDGEIVLGERRITSEEFLNGKPFPDSEPVLHVNLPISVEKKNAFVKEAARKR